MKFGEAFTEYLHNDRERYFLEKCSHVEYKRLKKVLKTCQTLHDSDTAEQEEEEEEAEAAAHQNQQSCQCQSCSCKHFFFFSFF